MGIDDKFVTHGTVKELQKLNNLDEDGIFDKILQVHSLLKEDSIEKNELKNVLPLNIIHNKTVIK